MNRTERKCLLASAALHGLLVVVLLIAPAFLSSRPKESKTAADFISAGSVEKALGGRSGGTPLAAPTPTPSTPVVPTPPQPEAPQAKPAPEPEPDPAVAPPTPPKVSKNALENKPAEKKKQYEIKPAPGKTPTAKKSAPEKKFELKKVNPGTTKKPSPSTPKPSPSAPSSAQKEWGESIRNLVNRIGKTGSGGVDIPEIGDGSAGGGGGGGGSGMGDYASLVKAVYDNAWIDPSDVSDTSASVKVVVVIARSGSIIGAKILSRSGNSSLDASVQNALSRVTKIPQPFPPDVRDSQLSFTINFNLGNRRRLG